MNPDEYTNQELMLDVGHGHQLYIHDWGKSDAATTVICLHGGPGGGTSDRAKQNFDPKQQRVIFFDQRGSGRSLPAGVLQHNTTDDLVADITTIADHLKLKHFILFGRSWGSALALIYAIKHPGRVQAVVTGGMFLATPGELDFDERAKRYQLFFPEAWEKLLAKTPAEDHDTPLLYHVKRILDDNPETAYQAAYIYSDFIRALLRLDDRISPIDPEKFEWDSFKIEAHYKLNNCFVPDGFIRDNAHKLTMPVWIVQGRYDVLCTPKVAYELHQQLPNSQLIWVPAGHAGSDRAVYDVSRTILLQLAGR